MALANKVLNSLLSDKIRLGNFSEVLGSCNSQLAIKAKNSRGGRWQSGLDDALER